MGTKSFFSEGVKPTGLHIIFELTIPCLCIKCHIPSAKRGEFVGRKVFDLLLNRFHFAHTSPTLAGLINLLLVPGNPEITYLAPFFVPWAGNWTCRYWVISR